VVVLEARDRVGGRLFSAPETGLDLGATWYWANEPRMIAIVAELGLEPHPQYLNGDALYQVPQGVQRLAGNPIEGPAGRLAGGMQSLARAMAETLPHGTVRLTQKVSRIRGGKRRLEIESVSGSIGASHVVLAVPPALAVAAIEMVPELDAETREVASVTPVWMGAMTKVVVRYPTAFWREHGLAGAVMSHVGPMREIHDMSGPGGDPAALFGFVPPTRPGAPTVTRVAVLEQLTELFGPEAAEPEDLFIHDWRTEVHTSPEGVETSGARRGRSRGGRACG
jgi:monoamine oxidase